MSQSVDSVPPGYNWQLDKRVPIALILSILVQTAGGVWYAAKQDARVEVLEIKARDLVESDKKTADTVISMRETLAGMKPTIDAVKVTLERIERAVDGRK